MTLLNVRSDHKYLPPQRNYYPENSIYNNFTTRIFSQSDITKNILKKKKKVMKSKQKESK